ncbi:MAG: hypothetical protein CL610_30150 [Anaerolineaceae bacterium]|nr:hypothetical protein [Anaerolineaceae bacterium]
MDQSASPTMYSPGSTSLSRVGPQQSLPSRISTVLFRPGYFFRTLPPSHTTRHWLWAAFLILALVGFAAVQQQNAANGGGAANGGDTNIPGDIPSDFPFSPDGGGIPPGGIPQAGGGGSATGNGNATWLTALTAGGVVVLQWVGITLLLAEVTLFNGYRPHFGRNLQIAIWSSVPLALMAALQLLFQMGGGELGQPGFTGFLESWTVYQNAGPELKSILYALTTHLTLFWLWTMALIYIGGREALRGKRFAVIIVVAAWVILQVLITGYGKYQELSQQVTLEDLLPPMEEGFPGDMPPGLMPDMGEGGVLPEEGEAGRPETEPMLEPDSEASEPAGEEAVPVRPAPGRIGG